MIAALNLHAKIPFNDQPLVKKKKKTGTENPDSDFRGIDGQQKGEDVVNAWSVHWNFMLF